MQLTFSKLNNIAGWLCFIIAAFTFLSTIEPSTSFWDCGEYITAASKLEVTHSPGAAFFQIFGAFMSVFAFGDVSKLAIIINSMSALSSALTILFLFWSITHLSRRILKKSRNELTTVEKIVVIGAGLVGALSFTFTDSFWFSATEGEVYAMASLFSALLIWLIFKWEESFDTKEERADKWLILIALVTGISTGVHLMAILIIPLVGLIYYFKTSKIKTVKNFLIANVVVFFIFGIVFKGVFSFTMSFFGKAEIFAVNTLGLPFNSGTFIAVLIYGLAFYFSLKYSSKKRYTIVYKSILGCLFLLIGFSSWLVIPVRAIAKPPMNLNDPSDALGMLDYYNREQYGSWPIVYGETYAVHTNDDGVKRDEYGAPIQVDLGPVYAKDEKSRKYIEVDRKKEYVFNDKYKTIFPRMFSSSPDHIQNYKRIAGGVTPGKAPSLGQNIFYFLEYQVSYMYMRYFMWNFVGRQNDVQGNLESTKGNWLSGISTLDRLLNNVDMKDIPKDYMNKATNTYYFIPLLLGILGLVFHTREDFDAFWGLFVAFGLTGIGIIIYTSVKPFEPRERDYAVVTSFYIFSMWIGLSIVALYKWINKLNSKGIAIGITILGLVSPLLLAANNWDDHDRSDRKVAYALAKGYLDSCDENAILFVYGDNDTYPLWYLQEVEQYRTDIKVINFTLLATDWHINQAKTKSYKGVGLKSDLTHQNYKRGIRDLSYIIPHFDSLQLNEMFSLMKDPKKWATVKENLIGFYRKMAMSEDSRVANQAENILSVIASDDKGISFVPTNIFSLEVDKNKVLQNKIVDAKDAAKIVDKIQWEYGDQSLYKNELITLDFIAKNNWERPVYFSGGGLYDEQNVVYLKDYLQYEGLVYKLVPIKSKKQQDGSVNVDELLKDFNTYEYGGLGDSSIYKDETNRRQVFTYRSVAARLADELIDKNRKPEALKVLNTIREHTPQEQYENSYSLISIIQGFYKVKANKKADELTVNYYDDLLKQLTYYTNHIENDPTLYLDIQKAIQKFNLLADVTSEFNKKLTTNKLKRLTEINPKLLNNIDGYKYGIVKTFIDLDKKEEAFKEAKDYLNFLEIQLKAAINAADVEQLESTASEFMSTTGLLEDIDTAKANLYKAKFEKIIAPIIEAQQEMYKKETQQMQLEEVKSSIDSTKPE